MDSSPTEGEKLRISRAARRQIERQARRIAKRDDGNTKKCIGIIEEVDCSADDMACQYGFNFGKKNALASAACTKETGNWGSGKCRANKGEKIVYCFCDIEDNCLGKDAMLEKAEAKYLEMNPTTTTTPSTYDLSGNSTTSSGAIPKEVFIGVGAGLFAVLLIGLIAFLIWKFTKCRCCRRGKVVEKPAAKNNNNKNVKPKKEEKKPKTTDDEEEDDQNTTKQDDPNTTKQE